jgi:mannose-6-phosphate isomerase-like protein (cupin superfamily)
MKIVSTTLFGGEFSVVADSARGQAAIMVLKPGDSSDEGLSNEHPRCEQWLYVISGTGHVAVQKIGRKRQYVKLRAGSLVVIEARELHRIRNGGRRPLRTLNFYIPPAYSRTGKVKSAATR